MKRTVSAFLMTLAAILAFSLPTYADEEILLKGKFKFKESRRSGDLELYANEAELAEIVQHYMELKNVKVHIGPNVRGKKITYNNKRFPYLINRPEEFVKSLSRTHGYFYALVPSADRKTKEIVLGDVESGPAVHRRFEFSYGSGKDQLGVEQPMTGPGPLAVDDKGDLYILDGINRRVQVYSEFGEHKFSIPLGEDSGYDMRLDNKGNIFILSGVFTLFQLDLQGNVISSIKLDSGLWGGKKGVELFKSGNRFYVQSFAGSEPRYVLVAKLQGNSLSLLSKGEIGKSVRVLPSNYGRKYLREYDEDWNLIAFYEDTNGAKRRVPLEKYFGYLKHLEFWGDDFQGNLVFKRSYIYSGQPGQDKDIS